jgi:hypothetical protein
MIPALLGGTGLALISVAAFGLAGPCCTSCAMPQSESATLSGIAEGSCRDSCCELCDKVNEIDANRLVGNSAETSQIQSTSFQSSGTPWLTPVGGVILVIAHMLNRGFDCLCSCGRKPRPCGMQKHSGVF